MSTSRTSDAPAGSAVAQLLRDAAARLAAAGVATPDVDAELLAAHVLDIGRGELAAASLRGDRMPEQAATRFAALVERRAAREPLQHLTGHAPFRHLELRVGPGVFVPRPETEMVAQLAIDALRSAASGSPIAVDLGTGSGALALAMATEVPHALVHAAENSVDAFIWAKENFARLAPQARLAFIDLARAFPDLDGAVSVVVSNPPYVPDDAIPRDPEVRHWDPPAALYGGADGLDVVRVLSGVALRLLHPGGTLVIEHGEWQGEPIRDLLAADGWRAASTHRDLTLRDRATTAIRP
ncbi:peptide chain release factor N(5)-glutamine methyltransferase [Microbacterium sp. EYE_5]|uniref:peptide chain release factor N(5)-glutamine methyltransferase n=1 Tax=unclassified Microbacterium TaxID=2609290 RepID=UPI00200506C9|nr:MULTISPECIES: peptide chain release factor N(5)-glutamine methyltransferase [unclassified Microbacterium]MCK6081406.1 peptide chain release factor N(5)-glutamine methyltransferase [Microbacterium sp. EYE_382]MCK6086676.1 peptide chain release factor N(5)-glutamine methyltransferase [Microbacterium sp. EYE_384]MCK6123826.1 peptide chain release factor N(5)-glutamine methyltransferase [Microbacterium sp. EYE_80]MCK6126735.1 peptide chain release factor N(5)-glutamine methyltransferase [Microba